MELGPVTKLDKRTKVASTKFDGDVISENCDVIVIVWIFGQFRAVLRADSRYRVHKECIIRNSNLLSYRNCKHNKIISNTALTLLL